MRTFFAEITLEHMAQKLQADREQVLDTLEDLLDRAPMPAARKVSAILDDLDLNATIDDETEEGEQALDALARGVRDAFRILERAITEAEVLAKRRVA